MNFPIGRIQEMIYVQWTRYVQGKVLFYVLLRSEASERVEYPNLVASLTLMLHDHRN
jgi:hypothetical protein